MIRSLLFLALIVPTMSSALDIKLGLMQTLDPLYEDLYDYHDDDGIVGRIDVTQRFMMTPASSINVFFTHMSLWRQKDPHHGINALGVEVEFNFDLVK